MRISVIDVGGNFCGPSLGLVALGHEVHYFHDGDLRPVLANAFPHRAQQPVLDADLIVIAASFGDEQRTAENHLYGDQPVDASSPFLSTLNPRQAEIRSAWLARHLPATTPKIVVDMSDDSERLAPSFRDFGDVRFKREWRPEHAAHGIDPFPFLYHALVLEFEVLGERQRFLRTPDQRANLPCLRFAGNVEHDRYAGQRARWLQQIATLEPDFRVEVVGPNLPVVQTWEALQDGRAGIYLAGTGTLCFRLHEYAAFGVPILAFGFDDSHLPSAWRDVLATSIAQVRSPVEMLQFYRDHYMPVRAAEHLLAHASVTATE